MARAADDATYKAARKANETKDVMKNLVKEAANNGSNTKESVKSNFVDAMNTVKDTARDMKSDADKAASGHQPKVEEAKEEAGQRWNHTENKATEFTSVVQDSGGARDNVAKEKAKTDDGHNWERLAYIFGRVSKAIQTLRMHLVRMSNG